MGYGLIEIVGNKPQLLEMGVLKLSKYKDANVRLQHIYEKITSLYKAFHPTQFAIEAPFFGKNVQSMLKLGRAQGVAIASAMQHGLSATEYSPKKIKQSITGNGNATKEQVWKMLQQILKFEDRPEFLALCHYYQGMGIDKLLKKDNNWESFLKNNAHRIKK